MPICNERNDSVSYFVMGSYVTGVTIRNSPRHPSGNRVGSGRCGNAQPQFPGARLRADPRTRPRRGSSRTRGHPGLAPQAAALDPRRPTLVAPVRQVVARLPKMGGEERRSRCPQSHGDGGARRPGGAQGGAGGGVRGRDRGSRRRHRERVAEGKRPSGPAQVGRSSRGAESARDWSVRTARSAKGVAAIADVVARAQTLLPDRRAIPEIDPSRTRRPPDPAVASCLARAGHAGSLRPNRRPKLLHRYLSLSPRSPRNRTNRFRRPRNLHPSRTPIPPSPPTRRLSPPRRPLTRAARRIPSARPPRPRQTSVVALLSFRNSPGT